MRSPDERQVSLQGHCIPFTPRYTSEEDDHVLDNLTSRTKLRRPFVPAICRHQKAAEDKCVDWAEAYRRQNGAA